MSEEGKSEKHKVQCIRLLRETQQSVCYEYKVVSEEGKVKREIL